MLNKDGTERTIEDDRTKDDLTLDLSRLPQWSPSETVVENWRRGVALQDIWFDCLSVESRRQYQIEQNDSRRAWMRRDVQFQIIEALFSQHLTAVGSPELASDSPSLAKLDSVLFRPKVCEIDWYDGVVTSLGNRFSAVHIVGDVLGRATNPTASATTEPEKVEARTRGRKSLSPLFAQAARSIVERDPLFRERTQEKQMAALQAEAKALAPGQFPGSAMPGRSTVARFVQRQRENDWPALLNPENPEIPN